MNVPEKLIQHCARYKQCKGCPLGTCVAPVGVGVTDPRWQAWINEIAEKVAAL